MHPNGYLLTKEPKTVTLTYANQNQSVVFESITISDKEPTGEIKIIKTNENGDRIKDATFRLKAAEDIYNVAKTIKYYSKGDTIAVITTDSIGEAFYSNIPLGKIAILEENIPFGYLLDKEERIVTLSYADQNTEVIYESITVTNSEPTGTLEISKKDILTENKKSVDGSYKHGDASIEGAEYTLYADEKITNVAGTITYFNKDDEIAKFIFDKTGEATVQILNTTTTAKLKVNGNKLEGIPISKLYLKETFIPEGYIKNNTIYRYNFEYKDMNTSVISKKEVVYNEINKEPFEIIKISSMSNDTAQLLENVEFTAILKRYVDYYGSYKEALKHTSEYAEDEWCVMKTDSKGYCMSKPLCYGTFIVNETYNPYEDTNIVKEFEITLTENSDAPTQHWKIENDTPFLAYLKFIKKDTKTGKIVTYSNATFQLEKYNEDKKVWENVQCKVGKNYYDSWNTNSEGIAYTETKLQYRII